MKLFEYQAKEAFREKGLPTPKGVLVAAWTNWTAHLRR